MHASLPSHHAKRVLLSHHDRHLLLGHHDGHLLLDLPGGQFTLLYTMQAGRLWLVMQCHASNKDVSVHTDSQLR